MPNLFALVQATAPVAYFVAALLVMIRPHPFYFALGVYFNVYALTGMSVVLRSAGFAKTSTAVSLAYFGALPLGIALAATARMTANASPSYEWAPWQRLWFSIMNTVAFVLAIVVWRDPCAAFCDHRTGGLYIFSYAPTALTLYVAWLLHHGAREPRLITSPTAARIASLALLARLLSSVAIVLLPALGDGFAQDISQALVRLLMAALGVLGLWLLVLIVRDLRAEGQKIAAVLGVTGIALACTVGAILAGTGIDGLDELGRWAYYPAVAIIALTAGLYVKRARTTQATTNGASPIAAREGPS
ncbi:MAG: hypothetical protein QOE90_1493 [Thermoplasmata archaeon]|jgi:hypothetical protein|nr:hypothetical protein [Thermoplasmata archaeon]